MKRAKCYLLDDENLANCRLEHLLKMHADFQVVGRNTCPEKAMREITYLKPDILFLDVEMPRLSGFDVIKQLKHKGIHPAPIFVTAFDQYSIKALRSEAFDYLIKPIDLDELNAALNRFRQKKDPLQIPQGWNLSEREKEVVTLVLTGKTSAQIAQELFLSKFTIDAHRKKILEKCGCNNFNELMGMMRNQ